MTDPLLDVRELDAGYGKVPVLRGVSLKVSAGEVVALLGPNGAGKTTLLRAVMGILPRRAGTVTFTDAVGRRRRTSALARKGVILVPDDRGLVPGLTVAEHFRLAQRRRSRQAESEMFAQFPQLADLRRRRAGLLSGGEQQMLALAKALLAEPHLLLVDEMSLGLAPKVLQELFPALRRVATERGIGVLLVEQHPEMALSVADRGVVMNRGEVVLEAPAADLIADRSALETAYFE
jgi:branched-chain amino acid transport system ATP-binding protein